MGATRAHFPTLFFTAIFSSDPEAIRWGIDQLVHDAGSVLIQSPVFEFAETDFYSQSMGSPLFKQLFLFDPLFDPAELADWKLKTNQLEEVIANSKLVRTNAP
ncbi:MAG: DUF4416 family protein [Pirellulaceae bacterium]